LVRVLHVSDTHLGAAPHSSIHRYRDVFEAFRETVDIAIEERVDAYIHAGDFFDRASVAPETYILAIRELQRLRESGIRVVIVAGQHDMPKRRSLSPLALLQELGLVDLVAIDRVQSARLSTRSGPLSVVAVPYVARRSISRAPRCGDKPCILVAHLLLKEVGIPSYDAALNDIPQGFDYVALGDYHGHRVLRLVDGTPVVYPGATEVFRVDEWSEDGKGVQLVEVGRGEARFERIRLRSVRPWIVKRFSSVQEALKQIPALIEATRARYSKSPVVNICVRLGPTETIAPLQRALDEFVRKNLVLYYEIHPETTSRPEAPEPAEVGAERLSLEELVKSVVEHEELAKLIVSLVRDPSEETARALVEQLATNEELLRAAKTMLLKSFRHHAKNRSQPQLTTQSHRRSTARGGGLLSYLGGSR